MECDIMDHLNEFDISSEYLPDLTEGKMSEQITFDEKVKKVNEKFVTKKNDKIRWLISPIYNKWYPKSAKTNKHAFKQNATKYSYDHSTKKLFLCHVCHDKIG